MSRSIAAFFSWPKKSGGHGVPLKSVHMARVVYEGSNGAVGEEPVAAVIINLAEAISDTYTFDAHRYGALSTEERGKMLRGAIEDAQQGYREMRQIGAGLDDGKHVNTVPAAVKAATGIADALNLADDVFMPLVSDPMKVLDVNAANMAQTWTRERNRKRG